MRGSETGDGRMKAKNAFWSSFGFSDRRKRVLSSVDIGLLWAVLSLMTLGLIMVTSASITMADRQFGQPFYYLYRQGAYLIMGISLGAMVWRMPLSVWRAAGPVLMLVGLAMLVLVLIPGLGQTTNGATRWLKLGLFNVQVSEVVKLFFVVYLAGYLVRRGDVVRMHVRGFLIPLLVLVLVALLLLIEPDFGTTVVIGVTALGMLLMGGVRLGHFAVLLLTAGVAFVALAFAQPYRIKRMTSFLDPWQDPFNTGFQLSQSLIAFGKGEWLGVGLGGSIQKLFYLPEAHTDFLFAIIAEELGFVGVISVIALFSVVGWRAFVIAREACKKNNFFGGYVAYGIGFWLVFQAFVNMGVNMGMLPTKGLTLPLMSYGGSSVVVSCVAVAVLLRVDLENRYINREPGEERRASW